MTNQAAGGSMLYDRIMTRLRAYTPEQVATFRSLKDEPDPEDRFTQLVQQHVGVSDTVIDLGTGAGSWFLREVAPRARLAIGLDESRLSLVRAAQASRAANTASTVFFQGDAARIPLPDGSAAVVVSRRGPLTAGMEFLREAQRVLAPGGIAIEITIGDQNCREVTEVFGDSQMASEATLGPRLPRLQAVVRKAGLEPVIGEDYCHVEYFTSPESLRYRLMTTPILADFDPAAHAAQFHELVRRNTRDKGIAITYHRIIWAARKTA